jgi:hypothetical protein
MSEQVRCGPLTARIRECWVDAQNRRLSGTDPAWTTRPTIHSIVIETVNVEPSQRQQGHFRRFLAMVCADPRFDMVVVEGVGNPHLAEFLLHEGWECDVGVMDFYRKRES